ncbi:phage tail protein [Solirubrobacter ginsenosidimutans]|uniref:Phage tail protein n=1 Tax=Solirubrobacter ginsenosidimutans TaxID=490573 RepID=A0A9X3MWV9_9ACTN|nr:hypothetical protein [Solirubrobacter ginsenosidimutans]MDA0162828.1 phage tail protein [Solirubrobacter ginsenosidimutans]
MIETFTAEAAPGGARLAWRVRGAETVTLSGHGRVRAEEDAFTVTLTATTTFVLVAYGSEFGAIESRTRSVERPRERVPHGTICLWAGTHEDIPRGWALCDGRDGRPNLLGRFVLGATEQAPPGETGDGDSHTHTLKVRFTGRTAPVPDHRHDLAWTSARSDAHLWPKFGLNRFTGITHDAHHPDLDDAGEHTHPVDVEVEWETDPAPVARPLGHALCFIVRSGDGDHAAG